MCKFQRREAKGHTCSSLLLLRRTKLLETKTRKWTASFWALIWHKGLKGYRYESFFMNFLVKKKQFRPPIFPDPRPQLPLFPPPLLPLPAPSTPDSAPSTPDFAPSIPVPPPPLSTPSNQCKLKCNSCQTKSILFFNKFHLILFCLFVSKMKKIVTKYVVCYSNN